MIRPSAREARAALVGCALAIAACCRSTPPAPSEEPIRVADTGGLDPAAVPAPEAPVAPGPAVAASLRTGDMAPPTSGPRTVKEFVAVDGMSLGSLPMGIGIPPGGPSYAAAVLDGKGQRVDVGTILRERGNVLLVFSRGGFCPYSSFEIRELARNEAAFRARGISILVVTADRPPEADKTRTSFGTPFPILSDSDLVLHDLYRVGHLAEAKELKSLALAGADIEAMSNRQHHRFAVPSLFLVGKKGLILWSHASEDERTRPKVSQILAALDARNLPPKEAPPTTAPSASSAPSTPH